MHHGRQPQKKLVDEPARFAAFLADCRMIPQCGDVQIRRIFAALSAELDSVGANASGQPYAPPAVTRAITAQPRPPAIALGGEGTPFTGQCHGDPLRPEEEIDVYRRFWRLAQFSPFIYLPVSVPEFAKTPAVLAAELGRRHDDGNYLQQLETLRRALGTHRLLDGLIILDAHTLDGVFSRQGRYGVLSPADITEQRNALEMMLAELPAGVECIVTDFEQARLSPATLVGEYFALFVMGSYMVFRSPPNLQGMRRRCHALRRTSPTLSRYLQGRR
ncbi:MAG: hypothetical protein JJU19_15590 [Pararhodobacter sp.]|nr:hypothetical protein [Pararhodobacter sp.]